MPAKEKEVQAKVKLQVPAGKATPAPPVGLSLIHISEPTRREWLSRMPSSA